MWKPDPKLFRNVETDLIFKQEHDNWSQTHTTIKITSISSRSYIYIMISWQNHSSILFTTCVINIATFIHIQVSQWIKEHAYITQSRNYNHHQPRNKLETLRNLILPFQDSFRFSWYINNKYNIRINKQSLITWSYNNSINPRSYPWSLVSNIGLFIPYNLFQNPSPSILTHSITFY